MICGYDNRVDVRKVSSAIYNVLTDKRGSYGRGRDSWHGRGGTVKYECGGDSRNGRGGAVKYGHGGDSRNGRGGAVKYERGGDSKSGRAGELDTKEFRS